MIEERGKEDRGIEGRDMERLILDEDIPTNVNLVSLT